MELRRRQSFTANFRRIKLRNAEQVEPGVKATHSGRLVVSSQDGKVSSWNATSVDAYGNGGRHLGSGRKSMSERADGIVENMKSAHVFVAQEVAQLEDSW